MKFLKVRIERYVSHDQPGFVLCVFEDACGRTWEITEKAPVLTSADLREEDLPADGFYVAGEIVSEDEDTIMFDTERPWGISAGSGETLFHVKRHQISDTSSDQSAHIVR